MLNLTKEEAIRRHRLMWNWIAQTSIQEQRCVYKREAFLHFEWGYAKSHCWCCEYVSKEFSKLAEDASFEYCYCDICPIEWPNEVCTNSRTFLFDLFIESVRACDYIEAAKYAYQIAELPEKR